MCLHYKNYKTYNKITNSVLKVLQNDEITYSVFKMVRNIQMELRNGGKVVVVSVRWLFSVI